MFVLLFVTKCVSIFNVVFYSSSTVLLFLKLTFLFNFLIDFFSYAYFDTFH